MNFRRQRVLNSDDNDAALAGNSAIAVTKFAASLMTGSAAMMSEAIHSLVDCGNQLLLLYGLSRAARPRTPTHPFGHGLQLYFWTFVVAVLIFGVGALVSIFHGIEKIQHPRPIEDAWINYLVLGLSIVFEGVVWVVALRAFNRQRGTLGLLRAIHASKNPTVFTVLFEDTAALLGLLVALAGVAASELLDLPSARRCCLSCNWGDPCADRRISGIREPKPTDRRGRGWIQKPTGNRKHLP